MNQGEGMREKKKVNLRGKGGNGWNEEDGNWIEGRE